MRTTTRFVFTLAVLVLLPRPAMAWDFSIKGLEFTLDATNTTQYTYRFDNEDTPTVDEEYHHFFNTLDVSLSHGDFRLGGRFDLNLFADSYLTRDPCAKPNSSACWASENEQGKRYTDQFVPERFYFIWARPEFDLTLGDFYASFGRGIALNVVKIGELSQDNAIRGGKFVLHQGDVELTFVGGQFNYLDVDGPTGWNGLWEADPVAGARMSYGFHEKVRAGIHGVFIPTVQRSADSTLDNEAGHQLVFGGGVEINDLWDDRLSLAAEINFQQTVVGGEYLKGSADQWGSFEGTALYATSTLQLFEDLTILTEIKYYNDFDLAARKMKDEPYKLSYNQAPTLEWIRAQISNNTSVAGGRVRLDYNFGEIGPLELLAFVNFGFFENWKNGEGKGSRQVINPMAGAEATWSDGKGQAQISGGLRREVDIENDKLYLQDGHLEVAMEQALFGNHSLSMTGLFLFRSEDDDLLGERSWNETELTLSYKWSPYVAVDFTYERQGKDEDQQEHFVGGGVKYFITPATYVQARIGQNRPGIKCISGTCRNFPAFSGAQVLLVGRFSDLNKWLN